MKNIHVLPTDKPSRLHLYTDENGTRPALCELEYSHTRNTQNIYITSDEEIKEGEYQLYNPLGNFDNAKVSKAERLLQNDGRRKKIILTTDQNLIKDSVQAIDNEFLEWFVKNPSCKEVETIKVPYFDESGYSHLLIIPKEEPFRHEGRVLSTEEVLANRSNAYEFVDFDKQETLEEAINKYPLINQRIGFKEGIKWQQERSYNKEDMKIAFDSNIKDWISFEEFIEQFKKK